MVWTVPFLSDVGGECNPGPWALVILNQSFSRELLDRVWPFCSWRACADGGANYLYDVVGENFTATYLPDLVKGDLDSIRPEVREFYASMGVTVVEDTDQDSTDLMKCVESISKLEEINPGVNYNVIILGGLSGRLDQTIHVLSFLHKERNRRLYTMVVTDDSLAWILNPGSHTIVLDTKRLGPTCGLLPVGVERAILSTSGLEWNLDNAESSFEGLMSTSNHVVQ
ncbi:hypothetical protein BS47DRAFT_1291536 [Hydnum rufescens UP504]|uniref:Thiamine pyrophosphokinase n=1 Tax=Hydnum rufescens UP504 TaxID=1448309 RepID=A0A9P6DVZ1_9AGAM|nr:hypothetical protein BS47DRAFT_1291536 [Hydnum rufescens UP504]